MLFKWFLGIMTLSSALPTILLHSSLQAAQQMILVSKCIKILHIHSVVRLSQV